MENHHPITMTSPSQSDDVTHNVINTNNDVTNELLETCSLSDDDQITCKDNDHADDVDNFDVEEFFNRQRFNSARKRNLYEAPEFVQRLNAFEEVRVGSTVVFECKWKGCPKPSIKWYKDDEEVTDNSRYSVSEEADGLLRLTVESARKEDEGAYKVKAENSEGVSSSTGYLSVTGDGRASPSSHQPSGTPSVSGSGAPLSPRSKGTELAVSFPPQLRTIIEQQSIEEREAEEVENLPPSPIQEYIDSMRGSYPGRRGAPLFPGCAAIPPSSSPDQEDDESDSDTSVESQTMEEQLFIIEDGDDVNKDDKDVAKLDNKTESTKVGGDEIECIAIDKETIESEHDWMDKINMTKSTKENEWNIGNEVKIDSSIVNRIDDVKGEDDVITLTSGKESEDDLKMTNTISLLEEVNEISNNIPDATSSVVDVNSLNKIAVQGLSNIYSNDSKTAINNEPTRQDETIGALADETNNDSVDSVRHEDVENRNKCLNSQNETCADYDGTKAVVNKRIVVNVTECKEGKESVILAQENVADNAMKEYKEKLKVCEESDLKVGNVYEGEKGETRNEKEIVQNVGVLLETALADDFDKFMKAKRKTINESNSTSGSAKDNKNRGNESVKTETIVELTLEKQENYQNLQTSMTELPDVLHCGGDEPNSTTLDKVAEPSITETVICRHKPKIFTPLPSIQIETVSSMIDEGSLESKNHINTKSSPCVSPMFSSVDIPILETGKCLVEDTNITEMKDTVNVDAKPAQKIEQIPYRNEQPVNSEPNVSITDMSNTEYDMPWLYYFGLASASTFMANYLGISPFYYTLVWIAISLISFNYFITEKSHKK